MIKIGFRTRLLLAVVIPAGMVVVLLVSFLERHANDLQQALQDRGRAVARQLGAAAEFYLFAGQQENLQRLVAATQAGDAQIIGVMVTDLKRELRASAGIRSLWEPQFNGQEQFDDGRYLIVATPIFRSSLAVEDPFFEDAYRSSGNGRRLVGYVVVELSREDLDRQRYRMFFQVLTITLGGVLFASWLSMRIAASVTRPLDHIGKVVASIERGNLSARTVVADAGVLAPLAAGINAMAARVATAQEDLRQQVALATDELRLQKEAAEMAARTDSLTGVANRRAFTERAEVEVQRALRYGSPLSLVMIDLDHFKMINDSHGHHTGDAVLTHFIHTITEVVREVDLVGRWGGEEFVVLLPGTGAAEAVQAAERMRQAVAGCNLQVHGEHINFSASFGVAQFCPSELTFQEFLARADEALYEAKTQGRNRVELSPPVASPVEI